MLQFQVQRKATLTVSVEISQRRDFRPLEDKMFLQVSSRLPTKTLSLLNYFVVYYYWKNKT
jgi:hypothetical protein